MVVYRDDNFCPTRGYLAWPGSTLIGRVLPGPIRNRVGHGFFKKKTRSGSRSGLGFIKKTRDPAQNPIIYNFIITKISSMGGEGLNFDIGP